MLGLYRLPLDQIGRELKLIPRDALLPTFEILARLEVAFYDCETEFVWVREMAGQRLHPTDPEQTLAAKDVSRWTMVQRIYGELPANPFLSDFFDEYRTRLRLVNRRPGSGRYERGGGLPDRPGDRPPHPQGDHPLRAIEQVDQKEDQQEHLTREHLNRRVETADAVEKPESPKQNAAEKHEDTVPFLPFGRLQLVPEPVKEKADNLEKAIADLVLNQLRRLQLWQSRDELTEAALNLCAHIPGLTRVRRSLVDAGIDRAFREAQTRNLTFTFAPGVRLTDVLHQENRDAG
jgi:hypothetical protein